MPSGADALLVARQRVLEKGDRRDVAELRVELARLGVAVRDEGRRQYWRRTTTPADPGCSGPFPAEPAGGT